jgi:lactoylglutathione lyase
MTLCPPFSANVRQQTSESAMPRVHHIALWASDINRICDFYSRAFKATIGPLYANKAKGFTSRFLSFEDGASIEVMASTALSFEPKVSGMQRLGFTHLAIALGSEQAVDDLARQLRDQGVEVIDGPRRTGDGYYECVALDPEGNRVEITA